MDASLFVTYKKTERMIPVFRYNSLLFKGLNAVLDQLILNFLFWMCCIGIVTIPASVSALCAVELSIQRKEEPHVFPAFFRAFRRNILQPLGLFAILLAAAAPAAFLLAGNLAFHWDIPGWANLLLITWLVCIYAVGCWAFPLSARYQNTLKGTLLNAVMLCFSMLPMTLLILFIHAVFPLLYAVMIPELLSVYTGYMIFFSTAVTVRLTVLPIGRVLRKLTPEEVQDEEA